MDVHEPGAFCFGAAVPVSNRSWSQFTASDYTPEQYCRAALIDTSPSGADKTKANCKLPVREPNGNINRSGAHAAASVLAGGRGGVSAPVSEKRKAARRLIRIYRSDLNEEPPESLRRLASG